MTAALLPPTVPEVRRLLCRLLCRLLWAPPPPADHGRHGSWWRRHHQAQAKRCHYRRRVARFPPQVRL